MQLILTAFVVGFAITSVQPNNQLDAKARTNKRVNEDCKLQIKTQFRNLFNSITTNDTRKSGTYRNILETEAKRGEEVFDAIKGEIQFARQRNTHKQRNLWNPNNNKNEKVLVFKREIPKSDSGSAKTNTNSNSSLSPSNTTRILVELPSIGYTGTWEQFCDASEMEKDYHAYPRHELNQLRKLLCDLHDAGKMDRTQLPVLALYKYCVRMGPTIDDFLFKLASNFAGNDPKKTKLLLAEDTIDEETTCYRTCLRKFSETCVEEKNPYFRMFKTLIARACEMYWLTAADIRDHIKSVCGDRLVVADIDWDSILESIKYKEA